VDGTRWMIQGMVYDESPAGLIVNFSGLAQVNGLSATAGPDGSYSICVDMGQNPYGTVNAQTTDWWGLASDIVWCYIR
jgi:hypothetical protein